MGAPGRACIFMKIQRAGKNQFNLKIITTVKSNLSFLGDISSNGPRGLYCIRAVLHQDDVGVVGLTACDLVSSTCGNGGRDN